MKKFIISLSCFATLLVLMIAIIEVALLYRPNIYAYKHQYMEAHLNDIKVLLLGSSHIEEAVKPEMIGEGTFNLAISARLKEYDAALAEMYVPRMDSLKVLVMPVDYTNFFFNREIQEHQNGQGPVSLVGTCRCMHTKYMGTRIDPIWYWSEILNSKLNFMSRFWNNTQVLQECDSLGYVKLDIKDRNSGWETKARPALLSPDLEIDKEAYQEMWQVYDDIAQVTQKKGVRFLLVTTPVYETYKDRITETMYRDMMEFIEKLQKKYPHIEFYNFIYAEGFVADDFNDSSHLTDTGAEKFSQMLSEVIYPHK
ncbi:hypothetical protein SAMN05216354_2108 [Xylanibacter ruminicola]|uniref:SGNH/GDSL hydrolase family protein n=1 Tax=Xylanibacter ruminicola TaxID=839 RepID=A0A1H5VYD1_XYLRU|nr:MULTISPECIES: hypothetical protein [Prevotellaceae]MCR5469336.1 hypothetical protein [Prevotella sp.]SEF91881.1 hypothetical protein SAMN05216354_2108 [Xylanibacter ruminicola]